MLRDILNTQGTKVVVAPPLAASTPLLLPKTLAIKKIPHNLLINANVSITRSPASLLTQKFANSHQGGWWGSYHR